MKSKICFVSVDVEDDLGHLDKILDIFKQNNIPATLFIIGQILERYKDKVRQWAESYEIACHGFTHNFWNNLTFEQRQQELEDFIDLYQKIFSEKPKGFRAPSHLIDEEGIKLLEEKGFLYDSSIVPHYPFFKKYRGFQGKAPLLPYRPAINNCRRKGEMRILEIPIRGQIGGMPLAGVWLAKIPLWFYRALFLIHRPSFITLNMHSWDVLNPQFLKKLEKILKILKDKNYLFFNGEQILKNQR